MFDFGFKEPSWLILDLQGEYHCGRVLKDTKDELRTTISLFRLSPTEVVSINDIGQARIWDVAKGKSNKIGTKSDAFTCGIKIEHSVLLLATLSNLQLWTLKVRLSLPFHPPFPFAVLPTTCFYRTIA